MVSHFLSVIQNHHHHYHCCQEGIFFGKVEAGMTPGSEWPENFVREPIADFVNAAAFVID
jgi:hypothetical protein